LIKIAEYLAVWNIEDASRMISSLTAIRNHCTEDMRVLIMCFSSAASACQAFLKFHDAKGDVAERLEAFLEADIQIAQVRLTQFIGVLGDAEKKHCDLSACNPIKDTLAAYVRDMADHLVPASLANLQTSVDSLRLVAGGGADGSMWHAGCTGDKDYNAILEVYHNTLAKVKLGDVIDCQTKVEQVILFLFPTSCLRTTQLLFT
jgi:hypothetical protein